MEQPQSEINEIIAFLEAECIGSYDEGNKKSYFMKRSFKQTTFVHYHKRDHVFVAYEPKEYRTLKEVIDRVDKLF